MKKKFILLVFIILFSYETVAQQITIQLGPEEIVFDWTTQKCNSWDVPDAPARAFRDINNQIQLLVTNTDNRRFIGSSLNNIALNCQSTLSSSLNSNPSQYNDHEWIASVYTLDGQTVHALVHNEYHGYLYNSACNNNYWACWYNAITYAKSTNAGVNYAQVATPNHLVASIPYQYISNVGSPYGYYNPSNIIFKDGYYYSFVHTFEYMSQPSGACPMRTQNIADPTSWRYWDGAGFNNIPVNPYLTTTNPGSHLCQPIDPQDLKRIATSLTYNNYLDKYIMLGTEVTGYLASEQGFFYSVSDDLLNWEPLQLLMSTTLPGTPAATTSDMWYAYPSLLEETPSRNFEVTGRTPYLYYTRKNPNTPPIGAAQGFDRDLVRRQVTFTISSPPPQFDFSISNSGSINLAQGSSSSNTINANLISGTAQPVTFSVNGLPQGAIHSFSSNSCSPICSVQLMITATSSTPAGNYPITVTGNGGGITKTITFTLGVSDTTPPSIPGSHYGSAISQSSVQLAWGAATDNVGVTGYLVDVSTSASFANYVSGWQGNNVGNILSKNISNLNPGTTYYSRVRAMDAAGNTGAHITATPINTLQQTIPLQLPTLPLVTNITYDYTTNFISLIWADSLYEQEYVLERSQENNPFVSIANLSADTTSYQDVSVSQNKTYLYRISAVNSAGVSAYSFGGITTIATVNYPTNTQPTTAQTQSTGSTTWPQSNSLLINQTSINSSGALQVSSYRTYLWIGALAFVLLALIIVLVKMFRRNRNSNEIN